VWTEYSLLHWWCQWVALGLCLASGEHYDMPNNIKAYTNRCVAHWYRV
jgi:hypothetical protein